MHDSIEQNRSKARVERGREEGELTPAHPTPASDQVASARQGGEEGGEERGGEHLRRASAPLSATEALTSRWVEGRTWRAGGGHANEHPDGLDRGYSSLVPHDSQSSLPAAAAAAAAAASVRGGGVPTPPHSFCTEVFFPNNLNTLRNVVSYRVIQFHATRPHALATVCVRVGHGN
eukprot:COSAG06_NODE_2494_length_6760_cov_2.766136_7_plen_176_part_00